MKKRYIISFVVAIIILSVLFLWNVGAGSVDISTSDLFAILAGSGKDETFSQIVWICPHFPPRHSIKTIPII